MLAITSYPALDVVIGLAFFYFLLSLICSSINEGIAMALNSRAKTLEAGIRQLLGSKEASDSFFADWRIQALHKPKRFLGWVPGLRDKRPAYIPSRAFALTILDTFAPAGGAVDDHDLLERAKKVAAHSPNDQVRKIVNDALTEGEQKLEGVRKSLERQFDESMERVSGWYKRRVQLVLFVIALALVGAINADSFTIGQRLWKDDVLRAAVVQQANQTVADKKADCKKPGEHTRADRRARAWTRSSS